MENLLELWIGDLPNSVRQIEGFLSHHIVAKP